MVAFAKHVEGDVFCDGLIYFILIFDATDRSLSSTSSMASGELEGLPSHDAQEKYVFCTNGRFNSSEKDDPDRKRWRFI